MTLLTPDFANECQCLTKRKAESIGGEPIFANIGVCEKVASSHMYDVVPA